MVHKGLFLLNLAYPWRWRKSVAKSLRRRGVNVITSDTVSPEALAGDSSDIETENGKSLSPDLIVSDYTPKSYPSSSFLSDISSWAGPQLLIHWRVSRRRYPRFSRVCESHPDVPAAIAPPYICSWRRQRLAGAETIWEILRSSRYRHRERFISPGRPQTYQRV